MVRGIHTRVASRPVLGKRRRSGSVSRPFKRRRVSRARKNIAFTSKYGLGKSIGFRSRRVNRKRWNRMLWNNTLQREHYRSLDSQSFSQTAANAPSLGWVIQDALSFGTPFWLAAGGARQTDAGTLPLFTGDIVLRGGKIGLLLSNPIADTTSIRVQVMLIRTNLNVDNTLTFGTEDIGWDPSLLVDFPSRVGRIIYRRDILLENGSTSEIEYRLRIQRIDQDNFISNKYTYRWWIMASNPEGTGTTTLSVTRYFNVSFSADAIGTT